MPLLTLPPEVRLRVYRFIFEDSTFIVTALAEHQRPQPTKLATVSAKHFPLAISTTCQLLRQESAHLILPSTEFIYMTCGESDGGFGNPLTITVPTQVLCQITYLKIEFADFAWNVPFHLMKSLRSVHVHNDCYGSKSLGHEIDQELLEQSIKHESASVMLGKVKESLIQELEGERPDWIKRWLQSQERSYSVKWTDDFDFSRYGVSEVSLSFDWDTEIILDDEDGAWPKLLRGMAAYNKEPDVLEVDEGDETG